MKDSNVIDVNYEVMPKEGERFSISEITQRLNISPTKLNHLIFKLNKIENLFDDTSNFTQKDVDLLELCKSLMDDGMSIENIVNYIKNDSNNLINPETGMQTRGMEETDLQIITRSATLEVKKQTDRIIEEMRENISKELVSAFTSESEKIAKVAIEAMGQTKLVIDKNLKNMENEIVDLKKENQIQNQEIERLYSNQATNLKKQLEDRQKKIEQLERENQELKNKSLFNRIFKR